MAELALLKGEVEVQVPRVVDSVLVNGAHRWTVEGVGAEVLLEMLH